jgi:K+-sensing histidine kinase KdpD
MHAIDDPKAETLLRNVLHDLRQPLGVLETTAYLINRKLNDGRALDREQLNCLERQVDQASRIVARAADELRRLHAQAAGANSRDLTNSATAVLT